MAEHKPDRPEFRQWVDGQDPDERPPMPLTHIGRALTAQDILRAGELTPSWCEGLEGTFAYCFYGRPAYRLSKPDVVKADRSCPFCFIFDGSIISAAAVIHAFDTGAFAAKAYNSMMPPEANVGDFSLGRDPSRPDRLIGKAFGNRLSYFNMELDHTRKVNGDTPAYELLAKSYLDIVTAPTNTGPDDRVGTIEVAFSESVALKGQLRAVVVPHTMWSEKGKAPWLIPVEELGAEVIPYEFLPGRAPDYYYGLIESQVRELYKRWGVL